MSDRKQEVIDTFDDVTRNDIQVLMVYWAKHKPMTREEVAKFIPDRHENNVRRSCARLMKMGYLVSAEIGRERANKLMPSCSKETFIMRHIWRLRPDFDKLIKMMERVKNKIGKANT